MKTFGYISLGIILIIAAFFIGKCQHKETDCPQADTIKVKVVVKRDTVYTPIVKYLIGKTIYVPIKQTDTSYTYTDSISDKNIKINIEDVISNRGEILGRQVGYKLFVPKEMHTTEYITSSISVKTKLKLFGMAGLGTDSKKLIFSGEIGINKNKKLYSIQYLRLDGKGVLMLKYGINF